MNNFIFELVLNGDTKAFVANNKHFCVHLFSFMLNYVFIYANAILFFINYHFIIKIKRLDKF